MKNNDIISCSDMIMDAFTEIESTSSKNSNILISAWRSVVTKIQRGNENDSEETFGYKLYDHSRIVEFKNEILLIEVDHSGWIQLFQIYKKFILEGLHRTLPTCKIKSIAFILKGSNARLCTVDYNKEFKKFSEMKRQQYSETDKVLEKYKPIENKAPSELPPELQRLFDEMRNTSQKRK